jgi:hypothetical protein
LTIPGVGSGGGDVKPGDGFEVSSWTNGDLFFTVQGSSPTARDGPAGRAVEHLAQIAVEAV